MSIDRRIDLITQSALSAWQRAHPAHACVCYLGARRAPDSDSILFSAATTYAHGDVCEVGGEEMAYGPPGAILEQLMDGLSAAVWQVHPSEPVNDLPWGSQ